MYIVVMIIGGVVPSVEIVRLLVVGDRERKGGRER